MYACAWLLVELHDGDPEKHSFESKALQGRVNTAGTRGHIGRPTAAAGRINESRCAQTQPKLSESTVCVELQR